MRAIIYFVLATVMFLKTSDTIAAEIVAKGFDQTDIFRYNQEQVRTVDDVVGGQGSGNEATWVLLGLLFLGIIAYGLTQGHFSSS